MRGRPHEFKTDVGSGFGRRGMKIKMKPKTAKTKKPNFLMYNHPRVTVEPAFSYSSLYISPFSLYAILYFETLPA
jgi:hypothetical protein